MKRLFSHNLKLKGLALLFALLSWYIVNQITSYDKAVPNMTLALQLPERWAVLEQSASEFQVVFRGTKEDLLLLDHRNVTLEADLRNLDFDDREYETIHRVRLDHRNVTHNSRARVYEIDPPVVEVRAVLEGSKSLPLRPNTTGEPARGLRLETVTIDPPRATLYGARERLESVTALQISPLSLTDRVGSFEQRVDVLPPTPDWVGRVEPSRVLARVTLVGLTADRRFTGIPVRVSWPTEGRAEDLVPSPATAEILLKGSPELLESLTSEDIRAFADPGEPAQNLRARLFIHVPPGVEVVDVQPQEVELVPRPPPPPDPVEETTEPIDPSENET